VSASAQHSFNRDSSSNSAFKLLTQEKGEIVISQVRNANSPHRKMSINLLKAQCFTHDVSIGKFSRSRFTCDFVNALVTMSNLGRDGRDDEALELYKEFVKSFGTHFMRKAEYGASLTFEKRYRTRSSSTSASEARTSCAKEGFGGCLGGSASAGAASLSVKGCYNQKTGGCENGTDASGSANEATEEDITITSKGSR